MVLDGEGFWAGPEHTPLFACWFLCGYFKGEAVQSDHLTNGLDCYFLWPYMIIHLSYHWWFKLPFGFDKGRQAQVFQTEKLICDKRMKMNTTEQSQSLVNKSSQGGLTGPPEGWSFTRSIPSLPQHLTINLESCSLCQNTARPLGGRRMFFMQKLAQIM